MTAQHCRCSAATDHQPSSQPPPPAEQAAQPAQPPDEQAQPVQPAAQPAQPVHQSPASLAVSESLAGNSSCRRHSCSTQT